ncbi:MAG: Bug family tripartite tricarboxylate transporter substrate binding protein [Pseudolabrys sp.]
MRHLSRLPTLIFCCLAIFVSAGAPSSAQTWPTRPVRFIVPLGPGSGVDITARMFADRLSQKWGQPVVVENKPGGDSFIAINTVLSAHDDHLLLFSPASSFTAHAYLHDKLPYDPKDLVPIARVTNTIIGIAVTSKLPVKTLAEMVKLARTEPGKLNWASVTGANELLFDAFLKTEKLSMAKVPYKNPVEANNDLAEGRIQSYVAAYAIMRPRVQAGQERVLALTNRKRAPSLPDIPTAEEAGFPSLAFDGLVGVLGTKDVSQAARDRIAADIKQIASDPEVDKRLSATGQVISPGTGAEFAKEIADQRATVAHLGTVLGIKPAQ